MSNLFEMTLEFTRAISLILQESLTSVDILKLARLVRIARLKLPPVQMVPLLRFLQKMDRFSQYSAVILSLLMVSFFLLAHWLACLWCVPTLLTNTNGHV